MTNNLNDPIIYGIKKNDLYHKYLSKRSQVPICPKCKKQCSPAGGTIDNSVIIWTCFDCKYTVEDVEYEEIETLRLNSPITIGDRVKLSESALSKFTDDYREFMSKMVYEVTGINGSILELHCGTILYIDEAEKVDKSTPLRT